MSRHIQVPTVNKCRECSLPCTPPDGPLCRQHRDEVLDAMRQQPSVAPVIDRGLRSRYPTYRVPAHRWNPLYNLDDHTAYVQEHLD